MRIVLASLFCLLQVIASYGIDIFVYNEKSQEHYKLIKLDNGSGYHKEFDGVLKYIVPSNSSGGENDIGTKIMISNVKIDQLAVSFTVDYERITLDHWHRFSGPDARIYSFPVFSRLKMTVDVAGVVGERIDVLDQLTKRIVLNLFVKFEEKGNN